MRKTTSPACALFAVLALFCLPAHAVTLANPSPLNFGTIDYAPSLVGTIAMGTNGSIVYGASFDGNSGGTAGQVEIQDAPGTLVEVSCANGTMAHLDGSTLPIETTAVVGNSNVTGWNGTPACAGLGVPIQTHTVAASPADNTLFVGGRLTPNALTAGGYSTTNLGGQDIEVQVVVQ